MCIVRRSLGGIAKPFLSALTTALWVIAIWTGALGSSASGQSIAGAYSDDFSMSSLGTGLGRVAQMAFAPGDDEHLYVATYGQGILRYDYDPKGSLSGGVRVVPQSTTLVGSGVDGSLGLAFHNDPTLGMVMYFAPAVPFTGGGGVKTIDPQSIVRVTDTNGDGMWGDVGDVNQIVVENLEVTRLHEIDQMQVRGDTLFVSIGSRTQNGGTTTPSNGDQSNPGETIYSGTVSFIEDLTQISGDTSTANIAGFNITNFKTDTQMATSTDPGKFRVYSTGFRNDYGITLDDSGEIWLSMNQNEDPTLPDEIHHTQFQDDHGFPKMNDVVGDWKTGSHASAVAAQDAGYFQNSLSPVATISDHAGSGGLDFLPLDIEREDLRGDILVTESATGMVKIVDPGTGAVDTFMNGLGGPLDVIRDPSGNMLVGENSGQQIFRITQKFNFGIYDLTGDGEVTVADWNKLKLGYGMDLTDVEPYEAFLLGDVNVSGEINLLDAKLFAQQYDEIHGMGAFASLVPEPSSCVLLLLGTLGVLRLGGRRRRGR